MKCYYAQYQANGTTYSSFIYAPNMRTAKEYAKLRNMGEKVLGIACQRSFECEPTPFPSVFYKNRNLPDCLHTLAFYSHIICRAKIYGDTACADILRDDGVLHEILHELAMPDHYGYREDIRIRLTYLERIIPGIKTFDPGLFRAMQPNKLVTAPVT